VAEPEGDKHFERVLVVAAHPDDPEFMCGATIAKLAEEGAEVVYVVCTDGSQGGPGRLRRGAVGHPLP
jgi:LmbE family N-acetylglucosaminyl deacetylase